MITKTPPAPLSVWRPINIDTFLVGAPHYPEHVDESYWERDAERMAAAGFNTVRLGEFAWHIFEPHENSFDFDLFDRAIEVLGRHGIKTIMCTPTATPPRWLTAHYPEVLRIDGNGRPASHGSRQHADTSSPAYRTHSQRITRAMADHYRDNPHVIGWQTDNELNTSESASYSASTRREFQKFLEDKYGAIEVYGTDAVRERFPAESANRRYTIKVGNREMTAAHMYELLELAEGTGARATWGNRFAEGRAAISTRQMGKGRVVYSGTYLTADLIDTFLAEEMRNAGVAPLLLNKPAHIEVSLRSGPRGKLLFVLNTADEPAVVSGLPEGEVVAGDAEVRGGAVTLPGYGCLVFSFR